MGCGIRREKYESEGRRNFRENNGNIFQNNIYYFQLIMRSILIMQHFYTLTYFNTLIRIRSFNIQLELAITEYFAVYQT